MIQWITELGPRWRMAGGATSLLLLLILLYPSKTTIVPQWDLRVVDDAHTSVPAINVTQHWQHYLLEADGHEDARRTNGDGRVGFPARTIRASLLRRVVARIGKIGSEGIRARTDPYAAIVAWGGGHAPAVLVYKEGDVPRSEIVVHRYGEFTFLYGLDHE